MSYVAAASAIMVWHLDLHKEIHHNTSESMFCFGQSFSVEGASSRPRITWLLHLFVMTYKNKWISASFPSSKLCLFSSWNMIICWLARNPRKHVTYPASYPANYPSFAKARNSHMKTPMMKHAIYKARVVSSRIARKTHNPPWPSLSYHTTLSYHIRYAFSNRHRILPWNVCPPQPAYPWTTTDIP